MMTKKHGLTIIEMIIAMILSGILVLSMAYLFTGLVKLTPLVEYGAALKEAKVTSREALVVMGHMTRVLRFADPVHGSIQFDNPNNKIIVTIEGGHGLNLVTGDAATTCYYKRDASNNFWFSPDCNTDGSPKAGVSDVLLSSNVSYFWTDNTVPADLVWNSATKTLVLRLKFTDKRATLPVETKVYVLGGL